MEQLNTCYKHSQEVLINKIEELNSRYKHQQEVLIGKHKKEEQNKNQDIEHALSKI